MKVKVSIECDGLNSKEVCKQIKEMGIRIIHKAIFKRYNFVNLIIDDSDLNLLKVMFGDRILTMKQLQN